MAAQASRSLSSAARETPEPMRSSPSRAAPTKGGLRSGEVGLRRNRPNGGIQPSKEIFVVVLEDTAGQHHVEGAARQTHPPSHGDGHSGQLIGQAIEQATGHGVTAARRLEHERGQLEQSLLGDAALIDRSGHRFRPLQAKVRGHQPFERGARTSAVASSHSRAQRTHSQVATATAVAGDGTQRCQPGRCAQ